MCIVFAGHMHVFDISVAAAYMHEENQQINSGEKLELGMAMAHVICRSVSVLQ